MNVGTARWFCRALGFVEIILGLGVGARGCALSVDAPGPSLLVMLVAFAIPAALVALPGAALAARRRWAWCFQLLPIAFAAIFGASYVEVR